jgi:bifunctional UDP-N-acetylglucosamine pyrophosphorylase/glucosamine-1-phosphate N-acetyltransferase
VDRIVVVTGHKSPHVEELVAGLPCVLQDEQLGTGHAVSCTEEALQGFDGSLLVLSGDSPLVRPATLAHLAERREHTGAAVCLLTTHLTDPAGYGRVRRTPDGDVAAIVEEKDCTDEQRAITEVNTGTYCFDKRVLFDHLHRLTAHNAQGEYYLTDIVGILASEGFVVADVAAEDPEEALGVNDRVQLAEATSIMRDRINAAHMRAGVTMTDPGLVWIGPKVVVGRDVTLEPMTFLLGDTSVGEGAMIGPSSRLVDCIVHERATVDSSVLYQAEVGEGATVGPMGFLRPGTKLAPRAKTGAFVEIKNSSIGEGSKVPHLSYIGDAEIGASVNIGAGSITCNYDGKHKHRTIVGDGAFVGSDTMMVAPVTIGSGAVTGAGSVVARDIPDDALGVERTDMRIIDGWAARRRTQWDTEE